MDPKKLRAAVESAVAKMEEALRALESPQQGADLEALQADFDTAKAEHASARKRLDDAEALAEAKRALPPVEIHEGGAPDDGSDEGRSAKTDVSVVSEPAVYFSGGQASFMQDQLKAQKGDRSAVERIVRNARELRDKGKLGNERVLRETGIIESDGSLNERAIAETAGAGGELVAPLFMQEEYLKLARAARPYWDMLTKRPLPPNTNSINIPRLKTGTSTAAQKDLGNVESVDLTTGLLTFPVITVAGQQDFARQLFDRAVPELADMVVFPDLVADYLTKTDIQALTGNGIAPNAKGVFESIKAEQKVTYTGAFKLAKLYSKISDAIQRIHTQRFLPPTAIVMHPRRWAACLASLDTQERPLIVPHAGGPFNVIGNLTNVASEAIVGTIQGLPVVVDTSIPTNLGAGTNQDVVLVQRVEDAWALEDDPIKTKVYEEVLSKELAIRCQAFNYLALTHERYPLGIASIEGTGLETPTF